MCYNLNIHWINYSNEEYSWNSMYFLHLQLDWPSESVVNTLMLVTTFSTPQSDISFNYQLNSFLSCSVSVDSFAMTFNPGINFAVLIHHFWKLTILHETIFHILLASDWCRFGALAQKFLDAIASLEMALIYGDGHYPKKMSITTWYC